MTEKQLAEAVRDKLLKAEALIASAIDDVGAMVKINMDAGRAVEGNAASMAKGMFTRSLGALQIDHAKATVLLLQHWPDFAAEVTVKGPGGR